MDTENGKADFVEALNIGRNRSYVLILHLDETTTMKGTANHPLVETTRMIGPKSVDKILNTVVKSLSQNETDQLPE